MIAMGINVKEARKTGLGAGRWWALGALALAGIVTGLDTTVVFTALPTLAVKLGASTGQLQWVMDSYLVVLSGLLLPAGVLGDRFGRKRLLVLGLLLFGVSSAFAALTVSADGLIALRALMGVGAAPILVLMYSILPSMFSDKERMRAVAVTSASTFVGLSLGPLVGGWLLAHYSWGSIFLINPPLIAIALLGVWFLVPESKDGGAPRLDRLGAVLSVAGVTALVYGIIEQPMYGWSGARVLVGVIGGGVLLTVFVVQQLRSRSPLIDLELFRTPRFSWSTIAVAVVMLAIGGVLFILTSFLQIVQGNDAQATGIRLLPLMVGMMVGAGLSDRLTARLGGKVMVAGGLLVAAAGALLLSRAGADTGFALIAAAEVVLGLGLGLAVVTAGDAALGALPAAGTGSGMALVRAAQFIAMSLGVAILGSILNGVYRTGLAGHLAGLPDQARAAANESIAGAHELAPHIFAAARGAYAAGMSDVLIVSAVTLAVGAGLAAAFLPSHGPAPKSPQQAPDADGQGATVHVKIR